MLLGSSDNKNCFYFCQWGFKCEANTHKFLKGGKISPNSQSTAAVTESRNQLGWERTLQSSSPTYNTSLSTRPWHQAPHPVFPSAPPWSVTSPPPLGSSFQCLISLSAKNFFLMSNFNVPWCTLRLCPLVLSAAAWEKRPTPTWFHPYFRWLWRVRRSPLSLLLCSRNSSSNWNSMK